MSNLPRGFTKTAAVMVTVWDFAMYAAFAYGLYLFWFTDDTNKAQWAFIGGLLFNAASNAAMFQVLGRRTSMNRHPSGRDLNNGR